MGPAGITSPTPDEITAQPMRFLLHKRNGSQGQVTPLDGRVGAVVVGGRYFVTSPWETFIPEIHMDDIQVQLREDWGFGTDDIINWPQPFHPQYCHYALIRSRQANLDDSNDKWWSILERNDFVVEIGSGDDATGKIHPGTFQIRFRDDFDAIQVDVAEYIHACTDGKPNQAVTELALRLKVSYARLLQIPMSFRQASITFRKFQREYLELEAALSFVRTYRALVTGTTTKYRPPDEHVPKKMIGTILYGRYIEFAERLFMAGIPYWIVWPVGELPKRRIDQAVFMVNPATRICTKAAYGSRPLLTCQTVNVQKYEAIVSYYSTRLSCSNPFELESDYADSRCLGPTSHVVGGSHHPRRHNANDSSRQHVLLRNANRNRVLLACQAQQGFAESPHDALPEARPAWSTALSKVTVNTVVPSKSRGYVMPDAKLFVRNEVDTVRLLRYLRWRRILIGRLDGCRGKPQPLINQIWRTFLSTGLKMSGSNRTTNPDEDRIAAKRALHIMLSDDEDHMDAEWKGIQYSMSRLPTTKVIREIIWELNELNFRFELLEMDRVLRNAEDPFSEMVTLDRCYTGNDILDVSVRAGNCGLAGTDDTARLTSLLGLAQVMSSWRGGSQFIGTRGLTTANASYAEQLEQDVARFYTQQHFHIFARAACIPRRL